MNQLRKWTGALAVAVACSQSLVAADEDKAPATAEVQVKDIKLTIPKSWKQEQPSSKLRVAQFKIAPVNGDKEAAELVISQFGGGGGGIDENIKRWVNQFQSKDRKVKITKGKSPLGDYYVVDAVGTYNKPDGPPFLQKTVPTAGQRMLAVMLLVEDKGTYFLKLNGEEKTVSATASDLRNAFGAKAESEKEHPAE